MIFVYILGGIAFATLLFANFLRPWPKAAERPRPPRCERRAPTRGRNGSSILIVGAV